MEKLAETLPKIELRWNEDFERWLTEKKSKPISKRTLCDYQNLWHNCLEGRTLGWHLLKQLEGYKMMCRNGKYHTAGWARQIFRHYIRYLYSVGKLEWDTYSRHLLTIPSRKYGRKLAQKPILKEEILNTLKKLREAKRFDIYMLCLLILSSAIRFEHALRVLKNWMPNEVAYVSYLNYKRLSINFPRNVF